MISIAKSTNQRLIVYYTNLEDKKTVYLVILESDMQQVVSLYSGAGGIDEGAKQAGINTTIAIDNNPDACKTLKLNHPDAEVICGKVEYYIKSLPKKPLIVFGGPPCQQFSKANTTRSFDMREVEHFWQAVLDTKPKYHLMENVPEIKNKLYRKNYLVNAADYGVPQQRYRRFFTNLSLPGPTHDIEGGRVVGLFTHDICPRKSWVGVKEVIKLAPEEKYTIDMRFMDRNAILLTNPVEMPVQTITVENDLRVISGIIYSKKHTGMPIDKKQGRKIDNQEFRVLQGFPDTYQFYGKKMSVRTQICNAVPPPLAKAFFEMIQ